MYVFVILAYNHLTYWTSLVATHDEDEIVDKDIDAQLYNQLPAHEAEALGELDDDFIIQANGGVLIEDESLLEDPVVLR